MLITILWDTHLPNHETYVPIGMCNTKKNLYKLLFRVWAKNTYEYIYMHYAEQVEY